METQTRQDIAIIDWLGFSVRNLDPDDLHTILKTTFNLKHLEWLPSDKGWAGYKKTIQLGEYGFIAYGGKSQRDTVSVQLRPLACRQFKNLKQILTWATDHKAKITRCDVAHDDFDGDVINIEQARKWNTEDGYTLNGRRPHPREVINHDTTIGNTFYVGKRENGKMLRIYEKGKEQGDPNSTWCRAEVEFRSKDRVITWDILIHPGKYLAGAYPCLAILAKMQCPIKTAKKAHQISYEKLTRWAKTTVGKTINAMMIQENGDIFKVFEELRREGLPERLASYTDMIVQPISSSPLDAT